MNKAWNKSTTVHKMLVQWPGFEILRVHLKKFTFGLKVNCDVMIDQVRAIDNKRLIIKVGKVDCDTADKIRENLKIVLDLD